MSKLTQEEKRIRLAKAEGWTCPHGWDGAWPHRLDLSTVANVAVMHGVPPGQTQEVHGKWPNIHDNLKPVPDYFGDLNACHEAEKMLRMTQRFTYRKLLCKAQAENQYPDIHAVSATATQRAEALGQALGLWKEGE